MSMITRCPACRTLFRVVPDQLRISDGWVRCGKCAEVFDGAACMVDEPPLSAPPAPAPDLPESVAPPVVTAVAEVSTAYARQATEPVLQADADPSEGSTGAVQSEAPGGPPATDDGPRGHDIDAEAQADVPETCPPPLQDDPLPPPPAEAAAPDDSTPVEPSALDTLVAAGASQAPDLPADPPLQDRAEDATEDAAEVAEEAEAVQDVSFLRASRRKAFWRRRGVRAGLALSAMLLASSLSLQVALQEHDRLATQWPALRPALEQLCTWRDCEVGPWRQIDAIVIEGSSFNRLRGDVYRLGLGLRNTVALALAVPSIELSLTDNLDQTVLRRVLTPAELGLTDDVLAAGRDWNGSVTLQVSLPTGTPRIAGYRVLAFYP